MRDVADLERRHGGRLGVAVLDADVSRPVSFHGEQRFPLCSTHKVLSVAYVLARVDAGHESWTRRIPIPSGTLIAHSPVTSTNAGGAMTVAALCAAAMSVSDNTAANLLLDSFGGPPALTAFLRRLGDRVTRLDRREPDLNDVAPGDPRDTTTPLAMAELLRGFTIAHVLSAASRLRLIALMAACQTGDRKLRAGLLPAWRVGDKTGSGSLATTNDVAIVWPSSERPVIIAAYYTGATATTEAERDAVLADVGRATAMLVA